MEKERPPIFMNYSKERTTPFCHAFWYLRRMQMANAALRKTIGIQTAGSSSKFQANRKSGLTGNDADRWQR